MNVKEITLWHYDKYLETTDLRYFSNFFDLKNPKQPSDLLLKKSFDLIFGEMLEITENYAVIQQFNSADKIYKLEVKYTDVNRLIHAIRFHFSQIDPIGVPLFIKQLEKWNYKIDKTKDLLPQLDKIERRAKGLISEIESLKATLQKENIKRKVDIDEAIYSIERFLDLKYPINKKEISLHKWLLMQKDAEKKISILEKQNR